MALPIPQAELPVMATGEEAVLEGMCAQPPQLIRVALQQSMHHHLCPSPTALPSLLPRALGPPTWITGEKPWARSPLSNAFFVVPTSSSEPGPSAMARTAPKCSGICRVGAESQNGLGVDPHSEKSLVGFTVRAHVPIWGLCDRQPLMFLSLSSLPPLSLKIKYFF